MSTKIFYSLAIAMLILVIAAGCAGTPGVEQLSGNGTNPQQGVGAGTPQVPGGQTGSIDAAGTISPGKPSDNAPGQGASSQSGGNVVPAADLLTYTDTQYGFSIGYPNSYVILDEVEKLSSISPDLVHRVRFMDAVLAKGATANLEIPALTVEIYSNPSVIPLATWMGSHAPNGTNDKITIDTVQCTQVTMMTMMAPNQFVFCSKNNTIYKFTLAGQYTGQMLDSFKFGK